MEFTLWVVGGVGAGSRTVVTQEDAFKTQKAGNKEAEEVLI